MKTIEQIPVAEDLFRWSTGVAELIGSRCNGCGTYYFPKCLSCRNPGCTRKQVEEIPLSRQGNLHSYTIQGYRPPPLFKMDAWTPYALGLVELPEGLRVMGMLSGFTLDDIRIDTAVEVTLEPLYLDESGREVLTYKFRPVGTGRSPA